LPQIQVWINNDDPANVEKLVKTLNDAITENKEKRLKAVFVFVDDKGKSLEPRLTALAEKLKAPDLMLTYLSSKDEGVADYKVNLDPTVKNTVMIYRNRRITSKHVNLVADEKGLETLKASIAEVVK
jgi:hypothetical protein